MAQTNDIGIDLGTSNVVIYMKGNGIVFREPSVVAIDRETKNIIAFGLEAYRMIGRTPANVNVIRPLAQGEMFDFDLASAMLRFFVSSVIGKRLIARPRAVMSVPSGVKDIEKKALISAMFDAGVRSVDEIVDEAACDAVRDGIVLRAVRDVQLAENRASFVDDQLQKRRVLHVESADGERPPVADFRLFNQDGRDVAMVSGRPDARVFEAHPVPFRIVRLMFR